MDDFDIDEFGHGEFFGIDEFRGLVLSHVLSVPQLYDVPQKSAEWLARRTEQTASVAGANCGLSPYDKSYPEYRYAVMAGLVVDDFCGNIHTDYGERYEERVRLIQQVVFNIAVVESGSFRSFHRRYQSCSLDGESNAVAIRGMHEDGRTFHWKLGKLCCEDKTSRLHFYATPRVPHIAQLQYQMGVMGRWWGILHYWSRDRTRIWLMRYCPYFNLWMQRRLALMHEHVARKAVVTRNNPFFAHRWKPGTRHYPGCTVADWVQQEWFDSAKRTGCALRPRITVQEWRSELASLRMTQEEWDQRYGDLSPRISWRDGREVCLDAGNLATPPQPEMYLVYEFERDVPACDVEKNDPVCLVEHEDPAWFAKEFPHVSRWSEHMLELRAKGLPTHRDNERMQNLYITDVIAMPEADEPLPTDGSHNDTPDEHAEYEARLVVMRARQSQQAREKEDRKPPHIAAVAPPAGATEEQIRERTRALWGDD